MTQWKRDSRPENVRQIGDFQIFSEVNPDRETAHVVRFPDGRECRVLPNGQGGRIRSVQVRAAVDSLAEVSGSLGAPEGLLVYFRGLLSEYGLRFEAIEGEVSIEDWLSRWFEEEIPIHADGGDKAAALISDLTADGWEIVRKAES